MSISSSPGTPNIEEENCTNTEFTFACVEYLRNFDGDTFSVNLRGIHPFFGKNILIRVSSIDTAEMSSKNACAKKAAVLAKNKTQDILSSAKRIDLLEIQRDKFFRVDARVIVDRKIDLGKVLLEEKLAYPYYGDTKPTINWCNIVSKK